MKRGAFLAISFRRPPRFRLDGAFRVARFSLPPYRRDMGQQHRVRTKRKRRAAYLDRKKVAAAAKAPPVRREPPKPAKAKSKKQAAAPADT